MTEVYGTIAGRHMSYDSESDEESAIGSRRSAELNDIVLLPISKESPNRSTTKQALSDPIPSSFLEQENAILHFRDRFRGKGREKVGILESIKAIALSSWLNILLVNIPIAWVSHFLEWHPSITFSLCFLSMVPLERLFEYGGEQMAFYCGQSLGELVSITLNNVVEATLAVILLQKCELKLLQSTIVGVVLLHLLLVPGATFLTGGARIKHQKLESARVQLNHTLLTVGVMALLLPAAFFSALTPTTPTAVSSSSSEAAAIQGASAVNQVHILAMSRGMAIMLLIIYICSRVFFHRPPGRKNVLSDDPEASEEFTRKEHELRISEPEVNPWVCLAFLVVTVGIMAATAEWLVDSIDFVMESAKLTEEWFGLILLPIVSFSADGAIAIGHYIKVLYTYVRYKMPIPPSPLAKSKTIDLSIQFTLFWMPFLVLMGWWTGKPMSLLFDFYDVVSLIGACFLVNYVTADSKTNWVEGLILLSFYVMIGLCTWFYEGQADLDSLLVC
ncbi:hypothetical protein SERLA73DRAFT_176981 [Serpula lacrymans var. lacrymans S7.3]|uniref:Sodium/calcium exchanger membrane region domain-containing protein n=2 Tax=Serpula lacrymans var. lacrymans TaxID=341189 RepID=F8PQN8_SERL3|nr:uncharacterized protein SERLADRAFT_460352 [Serpula lacrymans var. lacrymans S7.9]EGO01598.1 hypothetical protein SERLA73DRAFT_176981 [Serpula lacrymans var. lacrymans S7.3]EGO27254.1 hypothetical protein SERLADRAFT_460352 [Serpula lacrymans var. lacrymans S7.9]